MSRIPPHDEFLELCAVSTSGQLTGEEQRRLQEHLAVCPSCREVMKQYEAVVSKTIPALAPDPENLESDPSWSQEQAEAALFERLTLEEELGTDRGGGRWGLCPERCWQGPPLSQPGHLAECLDVVCRRHSAFHRSGRIRLSSRNPSRHGVCLCRTCTKPGESNCVAAAGERRRTRARDLALAN